MAYIPPPVKGRRLAPALAGLLLVAACGGGTAAPSGTAGGGGATNAAAATSAAAATATSGATKPGATSGGPALASVLGQAKLAEYKVTYKITATGSGSSFSGEQSWFFKPPKARFDFKTNVGGQSTTMSIFSLPEGNYMCFAAGGAPQCLTTPPTGSPLDQNLAASFQSSLVTHPESYGGTYVESKDIAGQKALCYDVKALQAAAAGLSEGRFCWSDKGIPLVSSFKTGDGTWSMEATSVSTTVPDSDFTLPATPIKTP